MAHAFYYLNRLLRFPSETVYETRMALQRAGETAAADEIHDLEAACAELEAYRADPDVREIEDGARNAAILEACTTILDQLWIVHGTALTKLGGEALAVLMEGSPHNPPGDLVDKITGLSRALEDALIARRKDG